MANHFFYWIEKPQTSDVKQKALCPTANAVLIDLFYFYFEAITKAYWGGK